MMKVKNTLLPKKASMKTQNIIFGILTVVAICLLTATAHAQIPLDFDSMYDLEASRGFWPYSQEASTEFKGFVDQSTKVIVIITNFNGGPVWIASAADSRDIGFRKLIWRDNAYIINYRIPKRKTPDQFGLSFRPFTPNTTFSMVLQPIAGKTNNFAKDCISDCGENPGKYCAKKADNSTDTSKV